MAWLKWVNGRAYLYHLDTDGKEKSKPLGRISKYDAVAEKTRFENRYNSNSTLIAGESFGPFSEKYLKWHNHEYPASHKRIKQILNTYLIPIFGYTPINSITIEQGEQYKIDRSIHAAPATVQKEVRTLKAVLNKAVEWNVISRNPITSLRAPRTLESSSPPYYTQEQLNALYDRSGALHAAIWRLGANTGLRRNELIHIRQSDLQSNGIHVVSRIDQRTKSGKWRLVPYTEGAKQAIEVLQENAGEYLLPDMHKDSISRAFKTCAGRAGLPGSLHWLRHTYASHLIMQGLPIRAVQQVMGHSTIAVTEKYAHLSQEFIDQRISGLVL